MADPTHTTDQLTSSIHTFIDQTYTMTITALTRFYVNLTTSIKLAPWARLLLIVTAYIMARPYIEKFYAWTYKKQRDNEKKKQQAEKEARAGKKAKMSANSLRGGAEGGKVLGEVENSDDEVESEIVRASGVPEWNKMARKRQKKYFKNLANQAYKATEGLTDEQVLELLDWSEESDDEKKQ